MLFPEYESFDAVGLAEAIRSKKVSAAEALEAAIDRIEERDGAINAVIHRLFESARAATPDLPDGPFTGVPFLLKDLVTELKGEPLCNGSRFWRSRVADHDSELVARYRRAGLNFVGKTNTPEFGLQPTTEPALFGPTHNPWDLTRTAGGSSGGSAAGVAAGYVPAAHGGDGGGSIRMPSSCCGLFGLKPTRGRTPAGPRRGPAWYGATVEHVLTRSVRDSAALLDATHGPDPGAPYYPPPIDRAFAEEVDRDPEPLRIAFSTAPFLSESVDPVCIQATEEAALLLQELGHHVDEATPEMDADAVAEAFLVMIASETATDVIEAQRVTGRKARYSEFEPITWALHSLGTALSAADLGAANRVLASQTRKVGRFFEDYDVLVTPTLGRPPIELGSLAPTALERSLTRVVRGLRAGRVLKAGGAVREMAARTFDFMPYTPLFNVTGQPAMSVPLAWHEGLPIGTQFVGPYAGESLLFRLAGQLERARPWFDRRPPDGPGA
jgi:amidase